MIKTLSLGLLLSLLTTSAFADEPHEQMYLQQILNTLDHLTPTILAAKVAAPAHSRLKFHYVKYQDNQRRWHNGLLEDVEAIKQGITQQLNKMATEPHYIQPIEGDYE